MVFEIVKGERMKRQTAIRYINIIHERLKNRAGLIGTTDAGFEALRISRAWVFGSVVKGAENPNDLDILLECRDVGRLQAYHKRKGCRGIPNNAKTDPYTKRNSVPWPVSPIDSASKYLRRNLRMVRFHEARIDGNFGDIPETKVMIYPRNDFKDT